MFNISESAQEEYLLSSPIVIGTATCSSNSYYLVLCSAEEGLTYNIIYVQLLFLFLNYTSL